MTMLIKVVKSTRTSDMRDQGLVMVGSAWPVVQRAGDDLIRHAFD